MAHSFEVVLERIGPRKISVIKEVRELTGQGLAETKRLVEGAPAVVARLRTQEHARAAVARLREVGASASTGSAGASDRPSLSMPGAVRVSLAATGPHVIAVLKELRAALGCGLREAKELVDQVPVTLGPLDEERALALMLALTDAGASADIA